MSCCHQSCNSLARKSNRLWWLIDVPNANQLCIFYGSGRGLFIRHTVRSHQHHSALQWICNFTSLYTAPGWSMSTATWWKPSPSLTDVNFVSSEASFEWSLFGHAAVELWDLGRTWTCCCANVDRSVHQLESYRDPDLFVVDIAAGFVQCRASRYPWNIPRNMKARVVGARGRAAVRSLPTASHCTAVIRNGF